jgi:hypothetical protein
MSDEYSHAIMQVRFSAQQRRLPTDVAEVSTSLAALGSPAVNHDVVREPCRQRFDLCILLDGKRPVTNPRICGMLFCRPWLATSSGRPRAG